MGRRLATLALAIVLGLAGCSVPRWPVDGAMTSPFGVRRDGLRLRIHRGVDIAVPAGTPVRAMAAGRVAFAGTLRGYGRAVIIQHNPRLRTLYAHLSEIEVRAGDDLDGRAIIGRSGSSGRTTGPHLHFEILRDGAAEDPVPLLGGAPRPASSPHR